MTVPQLSLPWRDPLVAFAPLSGAAQALLLHDGRNGRARIFARPDAVFSGEGRAAFDALATSVRRTGGMHAGLFGYDLAAAFERLPHLDPRWPPLNFARYPAWAVLDKAAGQLVIHAPDRAAAERFAARLGDGGPIDPVPPDGGAKWTPRWTRETYIAAARRARDYVHAGDVFQVNLSQGFDIALADGDAPWPVFCRLSARSPAPHAAYLCLGDDAVVMTNSPERFLDVRDGRVEARPIKGTRPRSTDAVADAALVAELVASAKDRAENLMIVDLMRNDLSRVCRPGSVEVPRLCDVESYANVHHLVSTVQGRLSPGRTAFDLIRATFPPGSITGAPKVRAMEIIAELEQQSRGAYCGALGWLGANGACDLNVMIRTASLFRAGGGWDVEVRSGGAITIDSDPEAELEETRHKAAALRGALEDGA